MRKLNTSLLGVVLLCSPVSWGASAKEWVTRGVQSYEQGRLDEAEGFFKRAIEQDPDFAEGYSNLAQLYLKKGKSEQAEANFAQLSRIYQKRGDPKSAAAYHAQAGNATTVATSTDQTELNLGYIRAALSDYQLEHPGKYPVRLDDLVPTFIESLPVVQLPNHPQTRQVKYFREKTPDDQGGWGYVNNLASEDYGVVFLNCVHKDSEGNTWDSR